MRFRLVKLVPVCGCLTLLPGFACVHLQLSSEPICDTRPSHPVAVRNMALQSARSPPLLPMVKHAAVQLGSRYHTTRRRAAHMRRASCGPSERGCPGQVMRPRPRPAPSLQPVRSPRRRCVGTVPPSPFFKAPEAPALLWTDRDREGGRSQWFKHGARCPSPDRIGR